MEDNQISTKEFVSNIFSFFSLMLGNWSLLMIGLTTGTLLMLVIQYFNEETKEYRASITFNLELEGGNSQLGGLASAFGMPQPTGNDLFSSANFPLIINSKAVYERAFMKEVPVGKDSTKVLFINLYIDSSNIKNDEWAGTLFRKPNETAINYKFDKKSPDQFNQLDGQISNDIYNRLLKKTKVFPTEEGSLINLAADMENEFLCYNWINVLMETTEEFYKDIKTNKSRTLLKAQEKRLDSLYYLMNKSEKRVAAMEYQNPYVVDPSAPLRAAQSKKQDQFYSNQYYTQLANIEAINKVIMEQTPVFTVLEKSRLPLENAIKKDKLNLKLFSLVGLLIAIVFVVLRNFYQKIYTE